AGREMEAVRGRGRGCPQEGPREGRSSRQGSGQGRLEQGKKREDEGLARLPVNGSLELWRDILEELLQLLPVKLSRSPKDERKLPFHGVLPLAHDLEAVFDQHLVVGLRRLDQVGRVDSFHDHAMNDAGVQKI